jgi:hypothetical protein
LSVNFNASSPAAPAGNTNVVFATDGSGNISGYVPTSSSVTAKVDLTAQTAAVSATNLVAAPATARYRISAYLKVTTPATTGLATSTLGGVTITYADGTDSVPQTVVMQLQTQAGASATTNAGNSTTTVLAGEVPIYAHSGTAIQYAIAYASNTAAQMQFEAHLAAEQI